MVMQKTVSKSIKDEKYLPHICLLALLIGLPILFTFFGMCLIAAIIEELFFRGFLLKRVLLENKHKDPIAAVFKTSILFALLHVLNLISGTAANIVFTQVIFALVFGIWAGFCVWKTGSLLLPLVIHLFINFAAAVGMPIPPLYIDPGTGSMLFAVLIGVLGVLRFALKGVVVKLRFLLSGGKKVDSNDDTLPLVIYSDDKRYWPVFEPVVRELDARAFDVTYMTQSPDDPALKAAYPHLHTEFIGEGNKGFARLNFLKATMVLSTTPGLDVYQWKRSKDVKYYIHMPHAPGELTTYRMFGTDYYDALLLSGQYQIDDCRALEKMRDQPEKECTVIGIPYLDAKATRLECLAPQPHERTILVAPSWGSNSLLNRFGRRLIDQLVATGYHVIIRPHPQSFTSEKELVDGLMSDYPNLEWNHDTDNFDVLNRSDLMISDFSDVIFDFSLVFDKPVICSYTDFDDSKYDAWWLDTPIWTATAIPRIGPILSEENLPHLKELIDSAIEDTSSSTSRHEVRDETWTYRGEGAKKAVAYLTAKYAQLVKDASDGQ